MNEEIPDDFSSDEHLTDSLRWMHPLCGAPVANWIRSLVRSAGVPARSWPRAALITFWTLLLSPARAANRPRYLAISEPEPLDRPPLFVLGHWMSGTRRLAELLTAHDELAAPTGWQVFNPVSFDRIGWTRPMLGRLVPTLHPDGAPGVRTDGKPEDDEAAIAALTAHSYLHCVYFPQYGTERFRDSVLMDGLGEADRALWQDAYVAFLRALERHNGDRRLVLANPAHTGRLSTLLELFPRARFLCVHRNPFDLFPAMRRYRRWLHRRYALQPMRSFELDEQILSQYRLLMHRYFATRSRIPSERLLEIRIEDFESDPRGALRWIGAELDLPALDGSEPARPRRAGTRSGDRALGEAVLADEVDSNIEPAEHPHRTVEKEWAFALEELGYERPLEEG